MRPTPILALLLLAAPLGLGCKSTMANNSAAKGTDVKVVPNASTKTNQAFSPNPFTESFAMRATVVWFNADQVSSGGGYGGGHTSTTHHLVSNTGLFDSGLLAVGGKYSFTFAAPGTYSYHCLIHPNMVGTITINP